jgi:hypothetical protein
MRRFPFAKRQLHDTTSWMLTQNVDRFILRGLDDTSEALAAKRLMHSANQARRQPRTPAALERRQM